jgi:hypothetical protein
VHAIGALDMLARVRGGTGDVTAWRYDGEARRQTRLGGEHRPAGQHGGAVVGCYHGNGRSSGYGL